MKKIIFLFALLFVFATVGAQQQLTFRPLSDGSAKLVANCFLPCDQVPSSYGDSIWIGALNDNGNGIAGHCIKHPDGKTLFIIENNERASIHCNRRIIFTDGWPIKVYIQNRTDTSRSLAEYRYTGNDVARTSSLLPAVFTTVVQELGRGDSTLSNATIAFIAACANSCQPYHVEGFDKEVSFERGALLFFLVHAGIDHATMDKIYEITNFSHAYLKSFRMEDAYLRGAALQNAYLHGAWLTGADMTGTKLEGANMTGCKL